MRNSPERKELTNEQRVANIVTGIAKKVRLGKKQDFIYPTGYSQRENYNGKGVAMTYVANFLYKTDLETGEPIINGEIIEDGAEITIITSEEGWKLVAKEEGDSHEIVLLRTEGTHRTLEQSLDIIEQIIAKNYPDTAGELAATLDETEKK